jgi:protein-L-isoaspartate(D-aspartate) O-methyltransferase
MRGGRPWPGPNDDYCRSGRDSPPDDCGGSGVTDRPSDVALDALTLRDDMVDGLEHPSKGHVRTDAVAAAMRTVPREPFVDDPRRAYADRDSRCEGTCVLAPSTVARLVEALAVSPDDSVLVVGAGTGYTAAVLAELTAPERVHAVDIARRAVRAARRNLNAAGYAGVLVDRRDGADGLPEYAPFDRVLVEAGAVEPPESLRRQLGSDGRLVMPAPGTLRAFEHPDADGDGDRRPALDPVDSFGRVTLDPLLVEGERGAAAERDRTPHEDDALGGFDIRSGRGHR